VGAPPGYVGYEEGGQLTEKVRRKPYSIVLLDEVEKAHPDVFNLLLQALDDGHMTDGLGRKIDFKNTILIMTSNIGARQLQDFGTGVGFGTKAKEEARDENSKAVIQNALRKAFSPEFLNRVDDMIMFRSLERQDIHKIIDLELDKLFSRIQDLGYFLELTEKAKDFIVERGYDEKFGARPLKRAIQKFIEDPLAEGIINHNLSQGDTVLMDKVDDQEELSVQIKKAKAKKTNPKKEE
jgi:ATP-dependent Clp protease ATP-binding subunit ClpC